MTKHLLPHPIKHFQVTREAFGGESPEWPGYRFFRTDRHAKDWSARASALRRIYGNWNDYLVQPYRDDPNHIEVWTPEQFKARAGACAYEEAQYRHDLLLTETGELLAHAYSGVAVHPFSAYEEVEGNLSVETRNLKPTGGE